MTKLPLIDNRDAMEPDELPPGGLGRKRLHEITLWLTTKEHAETVCAALRKSFYQSRPQLSFWGENRKAPLSWLIEVQVSSADPDVQERLHQVLHPFKEHVTSIEYLQTYRLPKNSPVQFSPQPGA